MAKQDGGVTGAQAAVGEFMRLCVETKYAAALAPMLTKASR